MAFLDHNGESEFPFSRDVVFDAVCQAIPNINGMKIENADKLAGRVMVKAGVTLMSWGENIPIQLISISESKTRLQITSSPKTGILFGGAIDMGKNRKNIESIVSETSRILSSNNMNPTNGASQSSNSVFEELEKFKALLDKGIITEEEFNQKKKTLLDL